MKKIWMIVLAAALAAALTVSVLFLIVGIKENKYLKQQNDRLSGRVEQQQTLLDEISAATEMEEPSEAVETIQALLETEAETEPATEPAAQPEPAKSEGAAFNGGKLTEMMNLIQRVYIGDLDETYMTETLAEAMVNGVGDEWSYYISAEDYASYLENVTNSYVGIGVTIAVSEEDGGYLKVKDVTPDSPAYFAGIVSGDLIVAVEGASTAEIGLNETKNRVRGIEGTDVTITVRHEGRDTDMTITRASIKSVNVTYELEDSGIAYIRIRNFEQDCAKDTIAAIEDVTAQGASGIVFDLRYNPGGLKTELCALLDYILPEGVIFRSERYDGTTSEDRSDAACIDMPMAVLVNVNSYSAAEFFAAALQEYGVAEIVGTQTYGKGYFQQCFLLSDGSAVNISTGKYYTPNGNCLAGVGITPDTVVEISDEEGAEFYYGLLAPEDDIQRQTAEQHLLNP